MLGLALLVSAISNLPTQQTMTYAAIDGQSPKQLAAKLFSPQVAGEVVDGSVKRMFGPGHQYGVRLWTKPRPVDGIFCHRTLHATSLENLAIAWSEATPPELVLTRDQSYRFEQFATTFPEAATEESCAQATGFIGPREEQRAAALAAVRQLLWAMDLARRPGALPFALECKDEGPAGEAIPCQDSRKMLASLPVSSVFSVEFDTGRYEQYPGMSKGIIRQVAPTLEHPAVPTVRFGPYAGEPKSFFAQLERRDGQLVAVHLRRGTVIYH